ncbi:MAG: deoxyribonuclease IV [Spirochaetales bacterium]|nr:deoxyribonuclease IV [Spirochaetales bacterium]
MKYIGAHVSISGGVEKAPGRATEIGARALGMFTKNQRQWKAPPLTEETVTAFKTALKEANIGQDHVVVHDTYLINLGNPDVEKRRQSLDALIDEARRVEALGLRLLNFHPGSGLGQLDEHETLVLIGEGMKEVLAETGTALLLIEGTAGQGAHVGYTFEHLADLLAYSGDGERVGICLDTCHLFGAGFDLRTPEAYEETIARFDGVVGLSRLKAMHLNDSKIELGSRKDRHEKLGEGYLGLDTFRHIMTDRRLNGLPFILETPDPSAWKEEIRMLYGLAR